MDIPQKDEKKAKMDALRHLMGVSGAPVLTIKICIGDEEEEAPEEEMQDQFGGATDMVPPKPEEEELY